MFMMRLKKKLLLLCLSSRYFLSSIGWQTVWTAPCGCSRSRWIDARSRYQGRMNIACAIRSSLPLYASSKYEKESVISLVALLSPRKDCDVDRMSPSDLAYIGDVVYELFVRSRTVWPSRRTSDLQNSVVSQVRAEFQSALLTRLKEDVDLSDKEQQVLSRGRNSAKGNRRNPAAYQDATAFEALLGFLYISDLDRCREVLGWIDDNMDRLPSG